MLDLFEEIIILQVYQFKSPDRAPVVIDCGSNIGASVLYFKLLYPEAKVLAFEPNGEARNLLRINLEVNKLLGVTVYKYALGQYVGTVRLFKSVKKAGSLGASLIKSASHDAEEDVEMTLVSSYIEDRIDMIKIDVEGSEFDIIEDLIESKKLNLVLNMAIEFHPRVNSQSVQLLSGMLAKHNFTCDTFESILQRSSPDQILHCRNRAFEGKRPPGRH